MLQNNIWSIYFSAGDCFVTSDSPIIIEREIPTKNCDFLSLNLPSTNITFPLTSRILVRIWDREYYKQLEPFNRIVRFVNDEFVKSRKFETICMGKKSGSVINRLFGFLSEIKK